MPDYKEILFEKQRGGVLITLNRPEALNAITRPMLKELHNALDEAEADPQIRAIVITGAGRAFSSGFDQATTSGRRRHPMAARYPNRHERGGSDELLERR